MTRVRSTGYFDALEPDEIYNLGAQSHVRVSFDIPEYTGEVSGLGTVRLLEAIRETGIRPKFYQASLSGLFGKVQETPQTENTAFYRRSPYGCAKACAPITSPLTIANRMTGLPATAFFQSRERAAWRNFCFSKDHPGGRAH